MKKRFKILAGLALAGAMAFSMAACGGSDEAATTDEGAAEGSTLNIWCWNDEFQSRFNDYYPEVAEVAQRTIVLRNGRVDHETINENFTGKIKLNTY